MPDRVLIIDANNLMGRVAYTHRELSTPDGTPTGVTYGVIRTVISVVDEVRPKRVVMVWDGGHSKRRLRVSDGQYKQNRRDKYAQQPAHEKERSELIYRQSDEARKMCSKLGFYQFKFPGIEADDVIALYTYMVTNGHVAGFEKDQHVTVMTADKDFLQLVQDDVTVMLSTTKGYSFVTPKSFAKCTVSKDAPEGYPNAGSYLVRHSLEGDSGDDVDGVPGFGKLTTYAVLKNLGFPQSIDELFEKLKNIDKDVVGTRAYNAAMKLNQPAFRTQLAKAHALVNLRYCLKDEDVIKVYTEMANVKPIQQDFFGFEKDCYRLYMASLVSSMTYIRELLEGLR